MSASRVDVIRGEVVSLRPARLVRAFAYVIAGLHALNLAAQVEKRRGRGRSTDWIRFVDVDVEANLPTWVSSVLLLACSVSAWLASLRPARPRRGWRVLACALALLSADEVLCVHERVAASLLARLAAHRVERAWLWALGGALVAAFAASLGPFLRALSVTLRRDLVIAGGVFVTGGLGFEALGQRYAATHGWSDATYVSLAALEELLEMLGALLCLRAITSDLAGPGGTLEIRLGATDRDQ